MIWISCQSNCSSQVVFAMVEEDEVHVKGYAVGLCFECFGTFVSFLHSILQKVPLVSDSFLTNKLPY